MYRTVAWRRHQDRRRIAQWQHFYVTVLSRGRDEVWLFRESNRLRKHSHSCDQHGICRLDRELHKYRHWRPLLNARFWRQFAKDNEQ